LPVDDPKVLTMRAQVSPSGHYEYTIQLAPDRSAERERPVAASVVVVGTSQLVAGHVVIVDASGVELPHAAFQPHLSAQ